MFKTVVICMFSMLLFLCSCGKQYDCKDRPLTLGLVGFDSTELSELKVVAMDGNRAIDSSVFNEPSLCFFKTGETAIFNFGALKVASEQVFSKKYKWKITVLKTGKTALIGDIVHNKTYKKCGGIFSLDCFPCFNPIVSVNVDGLPYNIDNMGIVYIVK